MINANVARRALPALTTASSSGASTASATGDTSTSTSSYAVPTITPPSAKGNPHIWTSDKPSGTVFIAVGSVVGSILLAIVLMYLVSAYISRRHTEKQRYDVIDSEFQSYMNSHSGGMFDHEKFQFGVGKKRSSRMSPTRSTIRLLDAQEPSEQPLALSPHASNTSIPQELYSSLQDQNAALNRKSLFISPTVEIVNQQRKAVLQNGNNSSPSLISEPGSDLSKPERAASPERRKAPQTRHKSNLSSSVVSAKSSSNSPENIQLQDSAIQRAKVPSQYLEELLEHN
ncbi:LADA_0E10154g1_1 [Lachancea dasiensis]|uniref:LADA_0E10154g1_1 n=1 Tax=Lachancea dasiensis TaxID=1072105 RepID=A0A1G4JEK8_9SACH|nr:LADA_0E10154g1_1 [Lachancea dasiensis]